MTSTHERPHPKPPRRLPRVLPTPPKREVPPNQPRGEKCTLARVAYEEALYAAQHAGLAELTCVAIALRISRKVVERVTAQRCEQ